MFRELNGKKYPIPGMDTAMEVLRPGARYSSKDLELLEWEDDEGREPPTKEELNAEFQREVKIYNYYRGFNRITCTRLSHREINLFF